MAGDVDWQIAGQSMVEECLMNKMKMVWCVGSFLDESAVDVKVAAR
jgi:hypothetical protein